MPNFTAIGQTVAEIFKWVPAVRHLRFVVRLFGLATKSICVVFTIVQILV